MTDCTLLAAQETTSEPDSSEDRQGGPMKGSHDWLHLDLQGQPPATLYTGAKTLDPKHQSVTISKLVLVPKLKTLGCHNLQTGAGA